MPRTIFLLPLALCFACGGAPIAAPTTAPTEPYVGHYSRFAVASDHPEASAAGLEVLERGGSSADAAAATMLALGVVNPASSGLGGGAFILHYRAEDQSLTFIDAREQAPAASEPDMFVQREAELRDRGETFESPLSLPSQLGGLASGVPGEAAGIAELLARFGQVPRPDVVAPAIRLAEEGSTVSEKLAQASEYFVERLRRDPVMQTWLESNPNGLTAGSRLRQPELARTLRAFADQGAPAIYQGDIAETIARINQAQGGIMTTEDLAGYRITEREPLQGEFFGYRWVTAPPPSAGGFTMLQSLALLETWRSEDATALSPGWLHALAESWKGPYLDRARYFGDPDHVTLPLDALMGADRVEARRRLFDASQATAAERFSLPLPDTAPQIQSEGGGTSHLCVADSQGNVTAVTTTINLPFGAGYTAAGIVMNDEMDDFARGVGLDNAFGLPGAATNLPGPGRRPVSTMSPTIIFDEHGPVLCLGASGGSRIVTAIQQVALNHLVFEMSLDQAVAAPRVHHQGLPDTLRTEEIAPMDPAVIEALVSRGHSHELISNVAVVQAISIASPSAREEHLSANALSGGSEEPRLVAVSDPRKGGQPAGR